MIKNYIISYNDFINEAISNKDISKALDSILKYLNTKIGPLYQLPGFQTISKAGTALLAGLYYIDKNGDAIRFNWLSGSSSSEIHSVDFFTPENLFSIPAVTLTLNGESLARMLPLIAHLHKSKSINVDIDEFIGESYLYEARPKGSLNKSTLAKVTKGVPETDVTPEIKKSVKKLEKIDYADPDTIFDDVDAYVDMVLKGTQPSLIVCGGPGIGKTYGITKRIKDSGLKEIEPMQFGEDTTMDDLKAMGIDPTSESDGDWVHIKGATTAFTMYLNLFKYKNKLIVFDDCDSVFANKDGVNILKGALDSSEKRTISWGSKALLGKNALAPPRFNYEGKIIFISNLSLASLPGALRSRSFVVDINLRSVDVIKRIQSILPNIGKELGLTDEAKKRALTFLAERIKSGDTDLEISIRALINFAKIAQSGVPQWKRLMEIQAQNMSLK